MSVSIPGRMLKLAVSLGVVAAIIAACVSIPHVHVASAVLVLLLSVLIIANQWGFVEAATATGMGTLLLGYFLLPPLGWRLQSPEYWLVCFMFLSVALVTSYLAARAKREADEAVIRHRELERLYAFGRDLPIEGSPASIVAACLDSLARIFELEAVAFHDHGSGKITCAGPRKNGISADPLRDSISQVDVSGDKPTGALLIPIRCGGQPVGTLAVCGGMSEITFRAIADRIQVRLEEVRTQEKLRHAELTERNQELKTALLDSLVHEIKTPLSVIKTAVSSLLSRDSDAASRRELLTIANQEADRMDVSISEIFWRARVEAGTLQFGKGTHEIGPLVNETLNELRSVLGNRSVKVEVPDSLPPANCDPHMIKGVLKELLTNALKYSPSDSPLIISVRQTGNEIITSVADSGIGVQSGEEKRIFEKHYRGSVQAPGTGLGLALVKTIVEAHGGRLGVESRPGGGAVFHFSLPLSPQNIARASGNVA
jgi:two-component system sensor histidine kinase KdpD